MPTFTPVLVVHAGVALAALLLGPLQLLRRRRDRAHRLIGRVWVVAMALTCLSSFLIHDRGFTWLHALSVFTLASIVNGVVQIRRGNVGGHVGAMVGSYAGVFIAFAFAALVPTRAIQRTLHSDPAGLAVGAGVVALGCLAVTASVLRGNRADRPGRSSASGAVARGRAARATTLSP